MRLHHVVIAAMIVAATFATFGLSPIAFQVQPIEVNVGPAATTSSAERSTGISLRMEALRMSMSARDVDDISEFRESRCSDDICASQKVAFAAKYSQTVTSRFALVSYSSVPAVADLDPVQQWMHYDSQFNKRVYAAAHGYDLIWEDEKMIVPQRTYHWGKICTLAKWLPHYEWVMWVDTDVIIMNMSFTIEDILTRYAKPDTMLLLSRDHAQLNTGMMLIRRSKKTLRFLHDSFNTPREKWWAFEQGAMNALLTDSSEYDAASGFYRMLPPELFNPFPPGWSVHRLPGHRHYMEGDFVIHFPSYWSKMKEIFNRNKLIYNEYYAKWQMESPEGRQWDSCCLFEHKAIPFSIHQRIRDQDGSDAMLQLLRRIDTTSGLPKSASVGLT